MMMPAVPPTVATTAAARAPRCGRAQGRRLTSADHRVVVPWLTSLRAATSSTVAVTAVAVAVVLMAAMWSVAPEEVALLLAAATAAAAPATMVTSGRSPRLAAEAAAVAELEEEASAPVPSPTAARRLPLPRQPSLVEAKVEQEVVEVEVEQQVAVEEVAIPWSVCRIPRSVRLMRSPSNAALSGWSSWRPVSCCRQRRTLAAGWQRYRRLRP